MEQVVIVDAIRTPMGRSKGGAFRNVRAEDLSAHLMRSLLARNPALEAAALDDIYWGCVQQTLEQGFNIARNAALLAEVPHSVPADEVILQAPSPRRRRRMQWLTNTMRVQRHAHGRSDGGPHRCCQQQRIMVFGQQPVFQ